MQINNSKPLQSNLLNLIRDHRDPKGHLSLDDNFQHALEKTIDSYQLPTKISQIIDNCGGTIDKFMD